MNDKRINASDWNDYSFETQAIRSGHQRTHEENHGFHTPQKPHN